MSKPIISVLMIAGAMAVTALPLPPSCCLPGSPRSPPACRSSLRAMRLPSCNLYLHRDIERPTVPASIRGTLIRRSRIFIPGRCGAIHATGSAPIRHNEPPSGQRPHYRADPVCKGAFRRDPARAKVTM